MAKKPNVDVAGKVRLELRLDPDLYQRLQSVAEKTPVSINQLAQGILRWASKYAQPGQEAIYAPDGEDDITAAGQPGVVWFGQHSELDEDGDVKRAQIFFQLDFTDRRVVLDFERPGLVKEKDHGREKKR